MAKSIPTILTNRTASHRIIAKLQHWAIQFQGWKDARAALKARQRNA